MLRSQAVRKSIKRYGRLAVTGNMGACLVVAVCYIAAQLVLGAIGGAFSSVPAVLTEALLGEAARPLHFLIDSFFRMRPVDWLVAVLTGIITLMAGSPLFLGINAFFMRLVRRPVEGETPPAASWIFSWYLGKDKNIKAVLIHLFLNLLTVLWNLLFILLPLGILYYIEQGVSYVSMNEVDLTYAQLVTCLSLLLLAGAAFASIRMQAYMPAPYLVAQQPGLSVKEAFSLSAQITRGHLIELFIFQLSFIGWYILALFSMGLALIYIFPYKEAACAAYIRKLHFDFVFPGSDDGVKVSIQSKISRGAANITEDDNK